MCGRNGVHAARPSGSIWQCIFVETITPTSQTKSLLPRYPTSFPMTSAQHPPIESELELYSECKRRVYERGQRGEESRTWGWITLPWLLGYEDNPLAPKQGLPLLWKTPMKSTAKKWNKNKFELLTGSQVQPRGFAGFKGVHKIRRRLLRDD